MFSKKGLITVNTSSIGEDELMEIALGAGADDMQTIGNVHEITCDPSAYDELVAALREKEIPTEMAELSMVPQTTIEIADADTARKILKLMEGIDDHDDVQNTYSNFDISEGIIASLS